MVRADARVVVLSDTHLRGGIDALPDVVHEHLATADLILHAGDVMNPQVIDELNAIAPTHVVLGNNDHDLRGLVPEQLEVEVAGVAVAMVHDSGARAGASPIPPSGSSTSPTVASQTIASSRSTRRPEEAPTASR